ncbi:MAG: MlaD family protein [Steroidobacterales bacterium]
MEREANYVAVGSFVLLVILMAGLFVYWYSGSREHRDYTRYEIYFDGSVSGLSEGGPVRYLGVNVGRVLRIRIDARAADRVQVIADIDATTPISDRTVAQLSLQGVTGLLYIDLQQLRDGPAGRRVLEAVPSERYPVIRSVHSDFDVFLSSLPDMVVRVNELVGQALKIFSDKDIASILRAVGNVERASATLPASADKLTALLEAVRTAVNEAHEVIVDLHAMTRTGAPEVAAAMRQLATTTDNLAQTSAQLNAFVAENRTELGGFIRQTGPQIEALVRDSRQAAQEIRELSRSLRDDPSRLLYQPSPGGVEIPR